LRAPRIGGENRVQKRDGRRRVFLIDRSDRGVFRQQDFTAQRHKVAEDQPEQGRFPDPVASHHTDFRSRRYGDTGSVEKSPAPGVKDKILDPKHMADAQVGLSGRRRGGCLARDAGDGESDIVGVVAMARIATTTAV
jgi:hypothetical protein